MNPEGYLVFELPKVGESKIIWFSIKILKSYNYQNNLKKNGASNNENYREKSITVRLYYRVILQYLPLYGIPFAKIGMSSPWRRNSRSQPLRLIIEEENSEVYQTWCVDWNSRQTNI